jgi:hypothetical protein
MGAGVVQCLTDWMTGVRSSAEAKDFPLASVSRAALGHTQPPVQRVPETLFRG